MSKEEKRWDVFVCHASEDKESFVKPLVNALITFGAKVWYDEFTLSVGDSLSGCINRGLVDSRFGVVVLSPDFFKKEWPKYELQGLTAKEISGTKVILPIWHNVTREHVLNHSPILADKKAIVSGEDPLESIALKILEVIRPDLFTRVLKKVAFNEMLREAKRVTVETKKVVSGPIRHEKLTAGLIGRVRLVRAALWGAYTHSMDFWLDGFKRDVLPLKEVEWWEHVAACYTEISKLAPLTREQHDYAFRVVFGLCMGRTEGQLSEEIAAIPGDVLEKIRNVVKYRLPMYDIEDPFPEEQEPIRDEVLQEMAEHDIDSIPME